MNYDSSSSEDDHQAQPRRPRHFKPRINFNEITDPQQFLEKFRISSEAFEWILEQIGSDIAHPTARNHALTPQMQLMVSLRFLGNGGQYHGVGDMHGIHKSTVQRCLSRVCDAILLKLFSEEVRWPSGTNLDIPRKFMRYAEFPSVGGCVDGTLIPIDAPTEFESQFVDRKGSHSLNAIVVCGPNMQFYYASARWLGSVHDSRVLRNSSLFQEWDGGWRPFPGAILLGDSGYPLLDWLMTPIERPGPVNGVQTYLRRHKATRRLIECAIGILKEKFPCLNHLRLNPEFAGKVILLCITIFNIQKRFGMNEDIEIEHDGHEDDNGQQPPMQQSTDRGTSVYDRLVRAFAAE